jgi:hypothetical protein
MQNNALKTFNQVPKSVFNLVFKAGRTDLALDQIIIRDFQSSEKLPKI